MSDPVKLWLSISLFTVAFVLLFGAPRAISKVGTIRSLLRSLVKLLPLDQLPRS